MFNEIQQYIKDLPRDFDCSLVMADIKEQFPFSYQEIFNNVNHVLTPGDAANISSDRELAHYTKAEMLLVSIIEDATDFHHSTLTNLITHYTNDYIKTINADIEGIEEEARESADDRQQDIDCDNAERGRSI
jgi:hypothetical protein